MSKKPIFFSEKKILNAAAGSWPKARNDVGADQRRQIVVSAKKNANVQTNLAVHHRQPQPLLDVARAVVSLRHGCEMVALQLPCLFQPVGFAEEHRGFLEASEIVEECGDVVVDARHDHIFRDSQSHEIVVLYANELRSSPYVEFDERETEIRVTAPSKGGYTLPQAASGAPDVDRQRCRRYFGVACPMPILTAPRGADSP
jgi:hypothetical protein